MSFTLAPLGPGAAEITGLDCSREIDERTFGAVKEAYGEYPVLVFRGQTLPPPRLAAFGRRFGALERYPPSARTPALRQTGARETPDQVLYVCPDDPDVLIMTNRIREGLPVAGIVDNAEVWHSDASHKPEPCQAVAVHVVSNPANGGDTEFCDMRAVFDALPEALKPELASRYGIHHWSKSRNPRFRGGLDAAALKTGEEVARLAPDMRQPLVRTHPETGRPSLYISPRFTLRVEGLTDDGSEALLAELFAFAEEPRFHYRHRWLQDDLMIWDNRCLNHRVRGYASAETRCRHRISVAGDGPFYRPSSSAPGAA